jgi:hypothetical protein
MLIFETIDTARDYIANLYPDMSPKLIARHTQALAESKNIKITGDRVSRAQILDAWRYVRGWGYWTTAAEAFEIYNDSFKSTRRNHFRDEFRSFNEYLVAAVLEEQFCKFHDC